MSISFVAAGANAKASAGNVTPGLPAGWAAGDIHICIVAAKDNVTCTMPAGWAAVAAGKKNGINFMTHSFWRRAADGDSDPVVTHTAGSYITATIAGFRGCSASPIGVNSAVSANSSSSTITATTLTTVGANELLIFVGGIAGQGLSSGYSGTPTPTEAIDQPNTTNYPSQCLAYSSIAAGGTNVGARTCTNGATAVNNGHSFTLIEKQTLTPSGIASTAAIGTIALLAFAYLTPAGIASSATVGSPTIKGVAQLAPSGIPSGAALGTPAIIGVAHLAPSGMPPTASFGTAGISGIARLSPTGIASSAVVGDHQIKGIAYLSAVGIESVAALGTPTVKGIAYLTPAGIPSTVAFGVATITHTGGVVHLPAHRSVAVQAEDRIAIVAGEDRRVSVPSEDRTMKITGG
jgi:hypothetical protein